MILTYSLSSRGHALGCPRSTSPSGPLTLTEAQGLCSYLASLFASQPLVCLMQGKDKVEEPEGCQDTPLAQAKREMMGDGVPLEEPKPLAATLVASVALALEDVNSRLESLLTPELASTFSQREMSSLADGKVLQCLFSVTTEVCEVARLRCMEHKGAVEWLGRLKSKTLCRTSGGASSYSLGIIIENYKVNYIFL